MAKAISSLGTKLPILIKNTIESSKPKLATFLKYAKVELVPPTPAEFPQVMQGFGKLMHSARTGAWKKMSVKEAWLSTLVGTEVIMWFFVGECIGKRSLIGYQV